MAADQLDDHAVGRRGVSRRMAETSVALLLAALGALALWDSLGRGYGWTDEGPQSGYIPARLAGLLMFGAALALYSALRAKDEVVVTWVQLSRVAQLLVPLCLYIAAISWLGIYVASSVFLVLFMLIMGGSRWWSALVAGACVPLFFFILFEIEFGVPLPKGPLERLLGY